MFKKYLFLLLGLQLLLVAGSAFANELAGVIERMQGNAQIISSGSQKLLSVKAEVFQGDQITTGNDTELLIRMTDGAVLAVRPNSNLTITEFHFNNKDSTNDNVLIKLVKGGFRAVTGAIGKKNPQKVKFNTPAATIGIRGTDFEVAVLEDNKKGAEPGTYNKVFQGATYIENNQGNRVEVGPNQAAFSPANALQMAQQFGLLKQVPNVFFNGKYDNLLDLLQQEALNRLNSELANKIPGAALPSELKNLIPKLSDMFK
ncbi:MAG: FecR family protein [Methylotenera sp.]|nr:FecR family protein [Methylotenera sp.]